MHQTLQRQHIGISTICSLCPCGHVDTLSTEDKY